MGIADLTSVRPVLLAIGLTGTLDQPRIGDKIPDCRKSPDVLYLAGNGKCFILFAERALLWLLPYKPAVTA